MITKVISGGQTGIDQMGLKVAKTLGIPTGGTAPRGYKTEEGPNYELQHIYGLIESIDPGYRVRTQQNVVNSDGTVLFGNMKSQGSELTISYLKYYHKPYIINPDSESLKYFLWKHKIQVLNVAGNRLSKLAIKDLIQYTETLAAALKPSYADLDSQYKERPTV